MRYISLRTSTSSTNVALCSSSIVILTNLLYALVSTYCTLCTVGTFGSAYNNTRGSGNINITSVIRIETRITHQTS